METPEKTDPWHMGKLPRIKRAVLAAAHSHGDGVLRRPNAPQPGCCGFFRKRSHAGVSFRIGFRHPNRGGQISPRGAPCPAPASPFPRPHSWRYWRCRSTHPHDSHTISSTDNKAPRVTLTLRATPRDQNTPRSAVGSQPPVIDAKGPRVPIRPKIPPRRKAPLRCVGSRPS